MKEQDFNDVSVPWTQDWARYLSRNDLDTIASATATCADNHVTVASVTVTDDGTSVTFAVTQSGLTKATPLPITVHITLTGGAELEEDFWILFTNI